MKYMPIMLVLSSITIYAQAYEHNPFAIEQLFPSSPSKYVLDTCMQVCSDLVQLDAAGERISSVWMDALLGRMVRLQAGIERLAHNHETERLHADDLVYLLAMINRVDVAYESVHCEQEYQLLYHTVLQSIKSSLASLLTTLYAQS
ncbi:MAG: hypothetical protein ACHQVS_05040 [Candidatus Babeliales bacterium]